MKQYPVTKITNGFDYSYLRQYLLLISQLVIFLISKVLYITHILSANDTLYILSVTEHSFKISFLSQA